MKTNTLYLLLTVGMFTFLSSLSACSNSGGSTQNSYKIDAAPSTTKDSSPSSTPSSTPSKTYTVNIFYTKGPVSNGKCLVMRTDNQIVLGTVDYTVEGIGSVSVPSTTFDALVDCSGGVYRDESDGTYKTAPRMRSVVTIDADNKNVAITPLTELAVRLANNNYNNFKSQAVIVRDIFGLSGIDISTVFPSIIEQKELANDDSGKYAALVGAFCQLERNNKIGASIDEIMNRFYNDMVLNPSSPSLNTTSAIYMREAYKDLLQYSIYRDKLKNISEENALGIISSIPYISAVTPSTANYSSTQTFVISGKRITGNLATYFDDVACSTPSVLNSEKYSVDCRVPFGVDPVAEPSATYNIGYIYMKDSNGIVYPDKLKITIN